jgi:hypothetical protein
MTRLKQNGSRLSDYLIVTLVFGLTRAWLLYAGLFPDFEHVLNHHQYLDAKLLHENLASSLFFLHAQPPLWNAIIGLFLKIANGNPFLFSFYYLCFSFLLSLLIAFMVNNLVVTLTAGRTAGVSAALFYVVFSSAYFYEFYIFYQLFTAFLAVGCVQGLSRFLAGERDSSRLAGLVILLSCLVSLTLTWSLFHPIFVLAVNVSLYLAFRFNKPIAGKKTATFLPPLLFFSTLAAFIIPVKNLIVFDYFGSSTWFGMNLAQTAPRSGGNVWLLHQCSDFHTATYMEYQAALETVRFDAGDASATMEAFKSDGATPNLNNIGLIPRSRKCAKFALEVILNDVPGYGTGRWDQFIHTLTSLSDAYFYYPKGLMGSAVSRVIGTRNLTYIPYREDRYLVPSIALGISCLSPFLLWKRRKTLPKGSGEVVSLGLFQVGWVLILGLFSNGGEQNRMRFTVEPLLIFVVAFFIASILKHVRGSQLI